jgi:superfamily II DNA/RNA helicase
MSNKTKWEELEKPLTSAILEVINELGFEKMTPVQVSIS